MLKQGFSLIELMIVMAIISVLATMSLPTFQGAIIRAQLQEAIVLSDGIKKSIHQYYEMHHTFPDDNASAQVPQSKHLIGNFVKGITVQNGAIHIKLGNRINGQIAGKFLSLRPSIVTDSPNSPISWVCGYAEAVNGMTAIGDNQTSVPSLYLSPDCHSWKIVDSNP